MKTVIPVTAVWLRRCGGEKNAEVQVLVEIDGVWHLAIQEQIDSNFSYIAEGNGAHRWTTDPLARLDGK